MRTLKEIEDAGVGWCGEAEFGRVFDRIRELEADNTELAEAQKMRDFYRREGASDFEWGKAERARRDQRHLWAKAWKAAAKACAVEIEREHRYHGHTLTGLKRLRAVEKEAQSLCRVASKHDPAMFALRAALLEAPTDD